MDKRLMRRLAANLINMWRKQLDSSSERGNALHPEMHRYKLVIDKRQHMSSSRSQDPSLRADFKPESLPDEEDLILCASHSRYRWKRLKTNDALTVFGVYVICTGTLKQISSASLDWCLELRLSLKIWERVLSILCIVYDDTEEATYQLRAEKDGVTLASAKKYSWAY